MRLSMLSANAPPMMENTSNGPSCATPSNPTASDEFVWWNTWNGSAAEVIVVPRNDTAWPIHSRRKSRDTRRGVVSSSTRIGVPILGTDFPRRDGVTLPPVSPGSASGWPSPGRASQPVGDVVREPTERHARAAPRRRRRRSRGSSPSGTSVRTRRRRRGGSASSSVACAVPSTIRHSSPSSRFTVTRGSRAMLAPCRAPVENCSVSSSHDPPDRAHVRPARRPDRGDPVVARVDELLLGPLPRQRRGAEIALGHVRTVGDGLGHGRRSSSAVQTVRP